MTALGQPLPSATGFSILSPGLNLHGYLPYRASTVPMALCARNDPAHLQKNVADALAENIPKADINVRTKVLTPAKPSL